MADTEKGGLSAIDPMVDFSQKIRQQNVESQQVLSEHRKRLMDLMASRKQMAFNPAGLAFAAGMLAPTKTGSFGESLGYGMTGYAGEAEKQFRREQEEAKLAYELETAAQEEKRKMMGQELFAQLATRKKPAAAPAPVPAAAQAPAEASAEAPAPAPVAEAKAEAPTEARAAALEPAPVVTAPTSPDKLLAQVNQYDATIKDLLAKINDSGSSAFSDISNEQIAMLEMYSPEYAKMINNYRDAVNKGTTLDISKLNAVIAQSKLELDKVNARREQALLELRRREIENKEASVEDYLPGVGKIPMPKSFWDGLKPLVKAKDFNDVLNYYKANNLPINTIVDDQTGKVRFMTDIERDEELDRRKQRYSAAQVEVQIPEYKEGTFKMNQVDYREYQKAKAKSKKFKDPNILQHWFNGSEFSGVLIPGATIGTDFNSPELTDPSGQPPIVPEVKPEAKTAVLPKEEKAAAPSEKPPSGRILSAEELERQRKEEELARELRKKRGEKEIEADVELGTNMMKEGTNAQNIRIIAKNLKSIATSNPKILDVMQDTDVKDSLARTIQSGIITPWGSVSIDPKDLYVAVNNFAEKNKDKKITKADRDAYSLFLREIAQLTILERRMSRGEGAISDKETGLFQQVNILPSDSALAVRLKSELIEERANVTEIVGDAFYKYKKKTGGSYEDFTHSEEFKTIKKNYESRLDRIRDANAKLLGGVSAQTSQAVSQTELPPSARKQLAEGQITTFGNGQQWTLRNGKPVRIK